MTGDILHADVTIVGAGLVGLAAAVALHQAGYSVVVVDAKNPMIAPVSDKVSDDVWDSRIYAISPKNAQWLSSLGVWRSLNTARIGEMHAMEIYGDATQAPLTLRASDANAENLGFIVEAKALMQALLKQVALLGIRTLFNAPCKAVSHSASKAVLQLENQQVIESALLLAADGSQSWVRQQLNWSMQQKTYAQTAIVANFKTETSHGNVARQWFSHDDDGKNSILAWLPLPDNHMSIVWSVSTKLADSLLKLGEDEFTRRVKTAGGGILGNLTLMSAMVAFPLSLQKTNDFAHGCVILVGDAAHQIHPMAGQGVNLGFRDVIDLMDILKEKNQYQAVNDSSLLKRYTRLRKEDMLNMLLLTDGLYQLFERQNGVVKQVRQWGLSATHHQTIKKMLVANAIAL